MKKPSLTSTKQGHQNSSAKGLARLLTPLKSTFRKGLKTGKKTQASALSNAQYHLSRSEIQRVIAAAPTSRDQVIIRTFAETGIRRFELANLRIEDFRARESQLVIRAGKGNKLRVVPIGSTLRTLIRQLIGQRDTGYIFVSHSSEPLSLRQLNRIVAGIGRRAKVANPNPRHSQLTCHLFRHTFARLWKEQCGSIETLARILGHARPSTTWSLYGTESLQDMQRNYARTLKKMFPDNEEPEY